MAELTQFLNSGKSLKVVAAGAAAKLNASIGSVTITPAADQYVLFSHTTGNQNLMTLYIGGVGIYSGDLQKFGGTTDITGGNDISVAARGMVMMGGKGEAIVYQNGETGTAGSVTYIAYHLLEEV